MKLLVLIIVLFDLVFHGDAHLVASSHDLSEGILAVLNWIRGTRG